MKILSINNAYFPDKGGFSYRSTKIYENYARLGHEVTIITPSRTNNIKLDIEYKKQKGIIVIRKHNKFSTLFTFLKLQFKFKYDYFITHNFFWWFVTSLFSNKKKLVNEVHSMKFYKSRTKRLIQKQIIKYWLSNKTHICFVLANETKRILAKEFRFSPEKVIFTPNGYDKDRISFKRQRKQKSEFVIGYAGTLYEWQGD